MDEGGNQATAETLKDTKEKVMKKRVFATTAMLSLLLLLAAASAQAQTSSAERMKISIPFEFTVGNSILPAGEYTVSRPTQTCSCYIIQGKDDEAIESFVTGSTVQGGPQAGPAKLVFKVYEDRHFLSQVWMPGSGTGSELSKSRTERSLIKELGKSSMKPQIVVLVARR